MQQPQVVQDTNITKHTMLISTVPREIDRRKKAGLISTNWTWNYEDLQVETGENFI